MYIGVDGGGTKTAFVLIDEEGNLIASFFLFVLFVSRKRIG